ncbi:hypothetical protein [Taibaiella chishuiensis]|uniref:Uncharacterized protein n=1 Tax=Taibaiella chishuiensis TaxID=1434707 RepID=A0A2P8CSQ6_9BACT|nr:hypothetical protein [Taibaiella chishuiensis]PSK87977.1 hypothetical protein B0I18_1167 [Taibaiella chishuiensis]
MNTLKFAPVNKTRSLTPGERTWAPASKAAKRSADNPNLCVTQDDSELSEIGGFIDIAEVISFYIDNGVMPVADMKKLYRDLQAQQ